MIDNTLVNGLIFGAVVIGGIWLLMLGIKNGHDAEIQREKEIAKANKEWEEWEKQMEERRKKIREESRRVNTARRRKSVSRSSKPSPGGGSHGFHNDNSGAIVAATSFSSYSPSSCDTGGGGACF